MAEFAIALGILQVAGAGIKLTQGLYDFGSTASSAGEHTDFIGKNVSLYCRVLKTLGHQLKSKNPIHSPEALGLAEELHDQSHSLFAKIRALLPTKCDRKDTLSLKQRLLWNFRKSRVDYLISQLEYLKSTVSLLLQILTSGEKLRVYRRSNGASTESQEELSLELADAQNLLVERDRARKNLSYLQDANRDDEPGLLQPAVPESDTILNHPLGSRALTRNPVQQTLARIDAVASKLSGSDSRSMVLQHTNIWLAQLYSHWTTLNDDPKAVGDPLSEQSLAAMITASVDTDHDQGLDTQRHPETDPASAEKPHQDTKLSNSIPRETGKIPVQKVPSQRRSKPRRSSDRGFSNVIDDPTYDTEDSIAQTVARPVDSQQTRYASFGGEKTFVGSDRSADPPKSSKDPYRPVLPVSVKPQIPGPSPSSRSASDGVRKVTLGGYVKKTTTRGQSSSDEIQPDDSASQISDPSPLPRSALKGAREAASDHVAMSQRQGATTSESKLPDRSAPSKSSKYRRETRNRPDSRSRSPEPTPHVSYVEDAMKRKGSKTTRKGRDDRLPASDLDQPRSVNRAAAAGQFAAALASSAIAVAVARSRKNKQLRAQEEARGRSRSARSPRDRDEYTTEYYDPAQERADPNALYYDKKKSTLSYTNGNPYRNYQPCVQDG